MALYNDLTDEQKGIVSAWERNQRAWFNSLARLLKEARTLQAAIDASNGVRSIVASLDPSEEVPNSSGIAGAHDLTKSEWNSLITAGLDDFLVTYDTPAFRQLLAKAAGPTAGL